MNSLKDISEWLTRKQSMHVGFQRWATSINDQEIRELKSIVYAHLARQPDGVSETAWKVVRDGPSLAMLQLPDKRILRIEQLGKGEMWGNADDNDDLIEKIAALTAVWHNRPEQDGNWGEVDAVAEEMGRDGGRLHDKWAHRLTHAMPKNRPTQKKAAPVAMPTAVAEKCRMVLRHGIEQRSFKGAMYSHAITALHMLNDSPDEHAMEKAEPVGEVYGPKALSTQVALEKPLPPGTKLYTAAPGERVRLPDGMALVPIYLNEEMEQAAYIAAGCPDEWIGFDAMWHAALSAAPERGSHDD